VKDLYNDSYKPLKKATADGKISHANGLAELMS
jgi:hypothetical protein